MCSCLRRSVEAALVVASLAGASAASAYDYTYLRSNFDSTGEGWTLAGTGTLEWLYGHLRLTDSGAGDLILVAPATFHGDLSAFNGGSIWFALYAQQGCTGTDACGTVTISGPAGSASHDLIPGPPADAWNGFDYYVGPLTAEVWGVSRDTWAALLAEVTDIRILLDCAGEGEVLMFDEFTLVGGPPGLFTPTPYCALYDELPGDNVIRRTSAFPLPVNPDAYIDLLQYRIGNWQCTDPNGPLFDGQFTLLGGCFRLDLLFDGLVNPCGPVKRDCDAGAWVAYDPLVYGPNPLLGCINVDMDGNTDTSGTGETEWNPYEYLPNVSRFGYRAYSPTVDDYASRTATNYADSIEEDFFWPPQTQWHGAEIDFYLGTPVDFAFVSESAESMVGDDDSLFEAGEVWVMHGHHLERGMRDVQGGGFYCPPGTQVQFVHDLEFDHTTVSLVFPLWQDEEPDFDPGNQCSAYEILWQYHAIAHPLPTDDPKLNTILMPWKAQAPEEYLNSRVWRLRILTGSCYTTAPPDGQPFVWTDHAYARTDDWVPRGIPGDYSGTGIVDATDSALLFQFIAEHDGDPDWDSDGGPNNGSLTVPDNGGPFPMNFCLYDLNYDGIVNAADDPLAPGPLADLNADMQVDAADFALFALAMGGPKITAPPAGCGLALFGRADFNADADVDLADFARFQTAFTCSK